MKASLRRLTQFRWPKGINAILQLDDSDLSALARCSYAELRSIASACLAHSLGILLAQYEFLPTLTEQLPDGQVLTGLGLRRRLLTQFLLYYSTSIRHLITEHLTEGQSLPLSMDIVNLLHDVVALSIVTVKPERADVFAKLIERPSRPEPIQKALNFYKEHAKDADLDLLSDQLLVSTYLIFLFSCYVRRAVLSQSTGYPEPQSQDDRLRDQTMSLNRYVIGATDPTERQLALTLLESALDILFAIYEAPSTTRSMVDSPFSNSRIGELELLARRDQRAFRQYGAKGIEKVFEQQLALIVQSFGLYVVSTRIGERTVDLICISHDPNAHYTFVLEAKTSQRPYALPTSDARAIVEYVEDVRRSLTTLPPLMFVLIIGPSPAPKLEPKLAQLELRSGIPVRFLSAAGFAKLRESVPGPLQLDVFREHIVTGTHILPETFGETLSERYNIAQRQHTELVRALLPGSIQHRLR